MITITQDNQDEYTYHRGSNPHTAEYIVLCADDPDRITQYGDRGYAIPKSALIDIPTWVEDFAEQYYRQELGEDYDRFLPPEVNPSDIVNSAGAWDDPTFIDAFLGAHEEHLEELRHTRGIFGFKTEDGGIIFPHPNVPCEGYILEGE